MAPTSTQLRNRRQRRPHPYPSQQRFPPTEPGENDVDLLPQQNQAGGAIEAVIDHREFMLIVLLLLLRLFVAIILHGNTIRALTEHSDKS
ncbi:hypothetical protein AAF712_009855 [Marasmius tenuissimus]|uniref:Uncharacterized protein n=1 Tax=Marasmius tenuissimus TaxID=585030 RepID=A0ABR2ZPH7_9AGAR|nr:hypothetical protein PM082_015100 [Marasmius tenuissimus]